MPPVTTCKSFHSSSSVSTSILIYLAVYLCLKISFFIIEIVLVYNFHQYFYQHQLCFMFCPISVFIIKGHSFKLFYRSIHFGPLLGVVPGFLSLNGTLSSFSGDIFGGESLGISVLLPLNLSCVDQKDSPPSLGLLSKNSFIIQKKQSSNTKC